VKNSGYLAAIAIFFTLGKSIMRPAAKLPKTASFTFPESVSLSRWKLLSSDSVNLDRIKNSGSITGKFIAGKHYRYRQNRQLLDIEMRYLVNTNGDLKTAIADRTGTLSSALKQDSEGGFYSLYTDRGKAYLSACINSRGSSKVGILGCSPNIFRR
jgi:cyanosortase A-associated protein